MFIQAIINIIDSYTVKLELKIHTLFDKNLYKKENSQDYITCEFYEKNIFKIVTQNDITSYLIRRYEELNNKILSDPQRGIRIFYEKACKYGIIKIGRNQWMYDPKQCNIERKILLDNNNKKFSEDTKKKILEKNNNKCELCGYKGSDLINKLEFDHWIPFNKGGSNLENNCVLLCRNCNVKKKNNNPLILVKIILKNIIEKNKYLNLDTTKEEILLKSIENCI